MAEMIHLTVQEQNRPVQMTTEQARIIEAISPEAAVERVEGGAELTVTDYRGTTSVVINDGEPGEPGDPGQPGVSPTVTVTDITGGHRVTVTDATGPHSFDVMNGEPGEPGDPAKLIDDTSTTAEDRTWSAKHLNNEISAKYTKPQGGIPLTDLASNVQAISGTTPTITGVDGMRYVCGECATLTIVAPASGDIEVIFDSGSTPTVLTVTPPTGVTAVRWANGFDPTSLDANTTYDIIITDGKLGMVASWA